MGDNPVSRMKYRGEAMRAARDGTDIADFGAWSKDQDAKLEKTPQTKSVDLHTGEPATIKPDRRVEGMYLKHVKDRTGRGKEPISRETFYGIHK